MHNQTGMKGELRLSGPFTIRRAAELHAALQDALASNVDICIDLERDAEADISFVQLLISARVSARSAQKSIRLKQPAGGPLLDVLDRGGFLAPDQTGFWSEGALYP
jgi:ABC-type transporter Mla MlaB component